MISLSQTLKGLHWDKVPNDNDNEVGARGILYLLIFQQLGQLLRWSWGYNILLAPAERYSEEDGGTATTRGIEAAPGAYRDDPDEESRLASTGSVHDGEYDHEMADDEETRVGDSPSGTSTGAKSPNQYRSAESSRSTSRSLKGKMTRVQEVLPTPVNGNMMPGRGGHLFSHSDNRDQNARGANSGFGAALNKSMEGIRLVGARMSHSISSKLHVALEALPSVVQKVLRRGFNWSSRFLAGLWEFMNPPLWSMLIAIIVASVPSLQHLFFDDGTFIRNSVTRAISQSGGVAVPLILVVLGGTLRRKKPSVSRTPGTALTLTF